LLFNEENLASGVKGNTLKKRKIRSSHCVRRFQPPKGTTFIIVINQMVYMFPFLLAARRKFSISVKAIVWCVDPEAVEKEGMAQWNRPNK
jgi:hypothetical protein